MNRLSGLDGISLHGETAVMPTHVLAVAFVDPAARGDLTAGALSRLFDERAAAIPEFRRRLLTKPLGLGQPAWVEDTGFDIANHVRRVRLPKPGTMRELGALVGELHAQPLDRRRPLWEACVVQGLADGRLVVVMKFSHALADGVGAVTSLLPELMTTDPEAGFAPIPSRSAASMPGLPERLYDVADEVVANTAAGLRVTAKLVPAVAKSAVGSMRRLVSGGPQPDAAPHQRPPRTRLNAPLTARRSVAFAGVPMDDLYTIADAFSVTVNDVFLAATTSAVRRWSETHDGTPSSPIRTMMPISTRAAGDDASNSWSPVAVTLPVQLPTTESQLDSIHATTSRIKKGRRSAPPVNLADVIDLVPPSLVGLAADLYSGLKLSRFHSPVAHLITSNVPGPRQKLYCAGAHVLGIHPIAPLVEGVNLNVTAVSYGDTFEVGLVACPDNVEDVESIARGIEDAIGELKAAAEERTGRRGDLARLLEPALATATTPFADDTKRASA